MKQESFVSPVKVGQKVYNVGLGYIKEHEITEIYFDNRGGGFRFINGRYSFDEIGKYVFLTKQEAEIKRDEVWK